MSYNRKALSKAKLDLDKYKKPNPYKKDIIYTEQGQWKFPGQKTRIPSSDITMQGVPYPVFAQPNIGKPQMMYPGQEYNFPGADYVDETPMAKKGGLVQMPKPTKKGLASKKYSRSLSATNKLFTENPLFKKPKSKKRKVFDPNAKYFESGGESDNNPPKSIVAKPSWYPEPVVNPAAYVSGFRGGNPNMYKYGFLTADKGNIIGGGGLGFPKSGIELSGLGVVPTSPLEREYFKGAYNAKISKDINRNLNLGLGVDTSITGYPGETGFVRDPIKFQPNLNLKYNFQPGGSVDVDVTEDDIAKYVNGGYIVEELPEMQPGGTFKPGTGYKMPTLSKSEMATIKKEVAKAKPVAAKSTTTVKKPNSSKQVNKSKEDAAYEKFLDQNLGKEGSNTYTYVDPITGKTEQREYSNAHLKDKGNIAVDEATYNANRDRQNMQHLSEALSGVGEITGINSAIRTGERIIDDPLKFAGDLTTGISQAPETLVEGAMTLGSKLFGDNKDYVDVDTDALGVFTDVVGALPLIGTAGKVAKPVLKSGLKYADNVIYPTRGYRASTFDKNLENLNYGLGDDPINAAKQKELITKVNKKGDFFTTDLEEMSQYLKGNEGRRGVFMGDDMVIEEVKIPFWKKNILSDSDVVNLKTAQGSVLPGQPRTMFQSEINANEYIIPRKNIFYPRKSTVIKAAPEEVFKQPVYAKNFRGEDIDISEFDFNYSPFSPDDPVFSNKGYQYLEDQITGATGKELPLYNPNPLQPHTRYKNYSKGANASGTASKVAKPIIKSAKLKEFFNRPPGPLMLGLGSRTKTPKTIPNFESEIDWVNWVKKHNKNYDAEDIQNVIKNSEEYNIIEQQTKANGTWMTNADGTPFQGTPEQFIQQQSTKFKQAYPEGTEITYRGGDERDALKSDWGNESNVVFTTKDEFGARTYNRSLDEPPLSLTEAPPEGISQLYMPQTTNKIVIDGNEFPIGHPKRKYGLPYIDDKGREVIDSTYRTNYARLNAIDQVPANELEAQNLEAFKNWMLEKHPTMTERGWSGEPRILNDWVMTDHFADFLNSPAGKDISRVEFQKIMDGTLKPIDVEVHNLNKAQQLKSRWGNSGEFDLTNPNKFKALLPYIIPTGLGTGAAAYGTSENNTEPQNKKGGNINNYAPGGELSPKDLDPATLEKYLSDLRDLENSIKKGYKNNKWYPHSSVEGGANTIAYGHKLKPGESFASGLTEQQARDLQKKDVLVHQAKAEEYVDKKYGTGTYDKLPQNSQMMLTDYAYNLGSLNPFPSFVEGVVKGDKNKMLQQYERRGLSERNKWTQNVINTTDFSKGSDEGFFDWLKTGWWNKKNGGAIEMDIKNKEDLKRYIDQGYIIEEL